MIDLQTAWNLIESINENANRRTHNDWTVQNYLKAIELQSECFRNLILELSTQQKKGILHWYNTDDEFKDYFKCLSNNMSIDFFGESCM